jgi:uncharacterized protein involved in exopolysaccharide biosynthesis
MTAPPRSAPPATPHAPPDRATTPRFTDAVSPPPPQNPLAPYVRALRKRLLIVVAIPVAFALVGLALVLPRPRFFEARAAFISSEPQSLSGSLGALSSVASQLGVPALSAMASGTATGSAMFYGDLLGSNAITRAIVTTTYDASNTGEFDGRPFKGTLVEYSRAKANTEEDKQIAAMRYLTRTIMKVTVDRPTGIVRFTVRTRNRQLSALVARRTLDLVNDFNLRRRQTAAGAEREFDLKRAHAALDTLRGAEQALADFRTTNIDFSRSPRLATREAELQRRVTLAQQIYTTIAQRYEIANIEAVRNTPVVTVIEAPEGLVEARPRRTALILLGVVGVGVLLAIAIALSLERVAVAR